MLRLRASAARARARYSPSSGSRMTAGSSWSSFFFSFSFSSSLGSRGGMVGSLRLSAVQIRAAAGRIGYADPEVLIKIRDEGFKQIPGRVLNVRAHRPIATRPSQSSNSCSARARADFRRSPDWLKFKNPAAPAVELCGNLGDDV
jgi:hypothetical protein